MKRIFFLLYFMFFSFKSMSQNTESTKNPFLNNVRIGGGVNIALGSNYSTFSVSPSAIYDFNQQFSAGISATYVYLKNKSLVNSTTNLYGGSLLAFYKPSNNFQFSTEFEQLKLNRKFANQLTVNDWQPALYLGVEYVTGNLSMGLRYDVLFDKQENIIYNSALSPIFRVYF